MPLPVPTLTPYSVKVSSFLKSIVLFSIILVIILSFTTIISNCATCYFFNLIFFKFVLFLLSLYSLSFFLTF